MTGPVRRACAFAGRHPLWWDVVLVLVLTGISVRATPRFDLLGVALVVVTGGAVLTRRRSPFIALFVAVTGLTVAVTVSLLTDLGVAWTYLAVWILLLGVGLRHGRRRIGSIAVAVCVVTLAAFVASADRAALDLGEQLRTSLTVAAMSVATYLIGVQINGQRKALAAQRREAAQAAVVAERSRIAQEMHDIIGHNLSVITSLATGGTVAVRRAPEDAEQAFVTIGEVSRSSVREVRRVLTVLRHDQSPDGAPLSPQPGLDDLDELVDSVRAAGVSVQLERTGDLGGVSAGRQLAVYRIVQESLTNVLRHGDSSVRADVRITRESDELEVVVDSSWTGAPATQGPDRTVAGHGIVGMRERAEAYGGTVDARPRGTGWRVSARLPAARKEQA